MSHIIKCCFDEQDVLLIRQHSQNEDLVGKPYTGKGPFLQIAAAYNWNTNAEESHIIFLDSTAIEKLINILSVELPILKEEELAFLIQK